MSAKSILEGDGKAILNYFLSRSPIYGEGSPMPNMPHNKPLEMASIHFEEGCDVDAVLDAAEIKYPFLTRNPELVAKPDQLIKRRGKAGLILVKKPWSQCRQWIKERARKDQKVEHVTGVLNNFIVESFFPHTDSEEYYININSERDQDNILFTKEGGVNVGDVDAKAKRAAIPVDLKQFPSNAELKSQLLVDVAEGSKDVVLDFILRLYAVYVDCQFTYLEINPLVIKLSASGAPEVAFLDLAAKLDQTAEYECGVKWAVARAPKNLGIVTADTGKINIDAGPPMEFPAPFGREMSKEEAYIADLDAKTGASLKLTILNSKGRVWTLVAGGGASVVYADAIASAGFAGELANYGEYSGAPTEAQTYQYAKTVLDLMLRAPMRPEGKVLFIGGGIANFTNVAATFKGVIRALREVAPLLIEHNVQIWVRRAGPNYQEGLKNIKNVANELGLFMKVYGPDMHVSGIVPLALKGSTTTVPEFVA